MQSKYSQGQCQKRQGCLKLESLHVPATQLQVHLPLYMDTRSVFNPQFSTPSCKAPLHAVQSSADTHQLASTHPSRLGGRDIQHHAPFIASTRRLTRLRTASATKFDQEQMCRKTCMFVQKAMPVPLKSTRSCLLSVFGQDRPTRLERLLGKLAPRRSSTQSVGTKDKAPIPPLSH